MTPAVIIWNHVGVGYFLVLLFIPTVCRESLVFLFQLSEGAYRSALGLPAVCKLKLHYHTKRSEKEDLKQHQTNFHTHWPCENTYNKHNTYYVNLCTHEVTFYCMNGFSWQTHPARWRLQPHSTQRHPAARHIHCSIIPSRTGWQTQVETHQPAK